MNKLLMVLMLSFLTNLFAKEVPYTLEDRDRLIRLETKLEQIDTRFEQIDKRFEQIDKRFEQIDKRFEQIEKRLDQLINIFIGIVAAFAGIVAVTIGFAIWDRRTTLSPVINMNRELERRQDQIEKALKEIAQKDPKFADALKHVGLL